ncbi:GNAT family N-acetyltransferase [Caldisalinibacter kiritimatiensis]|uniref:N-acetyltransferase domain-containing protein n=1 Tax=Caldisalinibacter kiritimatiensis TaxID=1304284 RepID=R1CSH2_9FIRM|nr:GNAT family N-acetyltransferase [Caldisalinibacter kiritimatiensis]EOD01606.1 hypothetical protein L21TH_0345 [Caldisalinibacter kiritimatiensis]
MYIYRATRNDIFYLLDMWKRLSDYHMRFEDYMEPSQNWREVLISLYNDDFDRADRLILIAKDKGKYIGFVRVEIKTISSIFQRKVTGYISDIYIDEEYRGSGLAESFMKEVRNWLKSKRIYDVRLNVNSQNIRAINFYKKMGFDEVNKTFKLNI